MIQFLHEFLEINYGMLEYVKKKREKKNVMKIFLSFLWIC